MARTRLAMAIGLSWLLSISTGCRSLVNPVDRDGVPLLRRPMWWGFYQRAQVYVQRGQWQKAAEDLEAAIGHRDGAVWTDDRDRMRARTYGLHILDDYFPRRELGICYYHLGRLSDAERELSISLRMAPSDRARAYLTELRRGRNPFAPGKNEAAPERSG